MRSTKNEKMIALGRRGAEFFYKRDSAHKVPKTSAQKIADDLNKLGYKTDDSCYWWVYDMDTIDCMACYQGFRRTKNGIVEYSYDYYSVY